MSSSHARHAGSLSARSLCVSLMPCAQASATARLTHRIVTMASSMLPTPALTPERGQLAGSASSATVAHIEHVLPLSKPSAMLPAWADHFVFELSTDGPARSPGSSLPSTPLDSPTWRSEPVRAFPQPPTGGKAAMLLRVPAQIDPLDSALWANRSPKTTDAPPPSPAHRTCGLKLSQAELSFLNELSMRLEAVSINEKIEAWRHGASEETMQVCGRAHQSV